MLGMAEPANWTFRPLSTPWLVLLPLPPPEPWFTAVAPASTLRTADDGPEEMLVETLRNNWPALARCKSARANCGRIAGALDIEIVLERQGDGIAQRQIDVAGAHQFVDARRIRKAHRMDVAHAVIVGQPIDKAVAVLHLQRVGLAEHRDGHRKTEKYRKK